MAEAELIAAVEDFLASFDALQDYRGPDVDILKDIKVLSAAIHPTPTVRVLIHITPELCNAAGNLHGGGAATIFDIGSSLPLALIRREGFWYLMGVSRTLHVSYLAPVRMGEDVVLTAELVQVGKRQAHLRAVMRRAPQQQQQQQQQQSGAESQNADGNGRLDQQEGSIVATCEHGKVNVDSLTPELYGTKPKL